MQIHIGRLYRMKSAPHVIVRVLSQGVFVRFKQVSPPQIVQATGKYHSSRFATEFELHIKEPADA